LHWIVLSWLFFGLVHSLMATDRVKTTVREYHGLTGKRYRQLYNVIAILSLAAALLVTTNYSGTSIIRWSGGWLFFPVLAWIIAIVFFVIPALAYDMGQFAGTHPEFCDDSLTSPSPSPSTSTSASVSTSTGLALSWCHRYVRHPWYFAILLIIWFRNLRLARGKYLSDDLRDRGHRVRRNSPGQPIRVGVAGLQKAGRGLDTVAGSISDGRTVAPDTTVKCCT